MQIKVAAHLKKYRDFLLVHNKQDLFFKSLNTLLKKFFFFWQKDNLKYNVYNALAKDCIELSFFL